MLRSRPRFGRPLLGLAAAVAFLAAGAAHATSVSLVWSGTSGGGIGVGTPTLTGLSVGDTVTLDVRVSVDSAGLSSGGLSIAWHPAVFSPLGFEVCPAGLGNPLGAGFCGSSPDPLIPSGSPFIDSDLGVVRGIRVAGSGAGQAGTTFTLARISLVKTPFTEDGSPDDPAGSLFEPYFFPDEGMLDSSGAAISPLRFGAAGGLSPFEPIVPEPSPTLLVGAGLVWLGVRRSRRPSPWRGRAGA